MSIGAPEPASVTLPWVQRFAREMEEKLSENRRKGDRSGWTRKKPRVLLRRLKEEVAELEALLGATSSRRRRMITRECADVANFAMMLADVAGDLDTRGTRASGGP